MLLFRHIKRMRAKLMNSIFNTPTHRMLVLEIQNYTQLITHESQPDKSLNMSQN
jgi:hypothetical protein